LCLSGSEEWPYRLKKFHTAKLQSLFIKLGEKMQIILPVIGLIFLVALMVFSLFMHLKNKKKTRLPNRFSELKNKKKSRLFH
jgi:hypothetical protein